MNYSLAIIGASGNVGRKVVDLCLERQLVSPNHITLFASPNSAGKILSIRNQSYPLENPIQTDFSKFTVCLFNTESDISQQFVSLAVQSGAYVIDSSSCYRLNPNVPLIVPPVNLDQIHIHQKLYAHANCLASPIATVIAPIHTKFPIKRANIVTYQSTSGAGKRAMDECWQETCAVLQNETYPRTQFNRQIALNIIPQVGDIGADGFTSEETKIIQELKKIVDPNIQITATAVRVPVLIGHAMAVSLEFNAEFDLNTVCDILEQAKFITVSTNHFDTPAEIVGSDQVFVGRIRRDPSVPYGLQLWICSDNLRRGAALDSVEIAEKILKLIRHPFNL